MVSFKFTIYMTRIILTTALVAVSMSYLFSQKVEIKDDKVFLDNTEILYYEKSNAFNHSLFSLKDKTEILFYKFDQNESPNYLDDDFIVLNFLSEKKKIESKDKGKAISGLGLNAKKNMQKLIEWLLKERVLNTDGSINSEKLDVFYDKYNENITNRTIRY